MTEIRIQGYGGQGAVTLATLLAQAATDSGKHAQSLPFFGVERRGAPVRAVVRISDDVIRVHSQACTADLVVVLKENLVEKAVASEIQPGARLVVNAREPVTAAGHPVTVLDAAGIAQAAGLGAGAAAVNVPMYAAACQALGITQAVMAQTLRNKWPGAVGEKNVQAALTACRAAAQKEEA